MRTKVSPQVARYRLAERRARLTRLTDLQAPEIIIENEKKLIANAIYELETGYTKEEPKAASSEG